MTTRSAAKKNLLTSPTPKATTLLRRSTRRSTSGKIGSHAQSNDEEDDDEDDEDNGDKVEEKVKSTTTGKSAAKSAKKTPISKSNSTSRNMTDTDHDKMSGEDSNEGDEKEIAPTKVTNKSTRTSNRHMAKTNNMVDDNDKSNEQRSNQEEEKGHHTSITFTASTSNNNNLNNNASSLVVNNNSTTMGDTQSPPSQLLQRKPSSSLIASQSLGNQESLTSYENDFVESYSKYEQSKIACDHLIHQLNHDPAFTLAQKNSTPILEPSFVEVKAIGSQLQSFNLASSLNNGLLLGQSSLLSQCNQQLNVFPVTAAQRSTASILNLLQQHLSSNGNNHDDNEIKMVMTMIKQTIDTLAKPSTIASQFETIPAILNPVTQHRERAHDEFQRLLQKVEELALP